MRRFGFVLSSAAMAVSLLSLILLLSVSRGETASGNFDVIKINFSNSSAVPPDGYLRDHGQEYGVRTGTYQGGGIYSYGWVRPGSSTPFNLNGNGLNRGAPSDVRLATLMQMERVAAEEGDWEIALPNGMYSVTVAVGDSQLFNSEHWLSVEDQAAILYFAPNAAHAFITTTRVVRVDDGRLSLRQTNGDNTKINYVDIVSTTAYLDRPSVVSSAPANAQTAVPLTASITISMDLPNGAIDTATVTTETVRLIRVIDGEEITADVSVVSDTIVLQPTSPLDLGVVYLFEASDAVKDITGAALIPYQVFFTADNGLDLNNGAVAFDRISVYSGSNVTSVAIGPDGKLYAGTLDGFIYRFNINADGSLSGQQTITTVRNDNGGARAILGMIFDPAATADNLILWISNNSGSLVNVPAWSSKLSRLTGANLENIEDVLINLPHSYRDHGTNGLIFGPDGALYFMQGSNTTMGAPDSTWGFRPERLLTAAVLRLDTTAVFTTPLDVKTEEGGSYDPYDPAAPLTIYASGTRNSYDLVWHSNGSLYIPTNGSALGGNTPGTPLTLPLACQTRRLDLTANGPYTMPQVITLTNVPQVQHEFLFRAEQGGYYGHPNPKRCEWVMNGGNPTAVLDPAEVYLYPDGVEPDRNWRGAAFDFGLNYSPNGVIEYQSDNFGGYLQGKLIVARYSRGDDLIVLTPSGTDGDIISVETNIPGFAAIGNPLDIVENTANGHLYVSSIYSGRIWLLRPIEVDVSIEKSVNVTTAVPLQDITYTLAISNAGPMAAANIVVTDTLPEGLSVNHLPPGCSSEVVCTISSIAAGEVVTLELGVQVLITEAITITNTATVAANAYDTEMGNQTNAAVFEVRPTHDLQVSKAGETLVSLNEAVHYTVTVTNVGPSLATAVIVTDTLPTGTLFIDASPGCAAGALVVCNVGELAVGETTVITLTAMPTMMGIVTNTVVVTSSEIELVEENNEALAVTVVVLNADLTIYKSASAAELPIGDLLTYTLTITNAGPSPATGVVVTDVLPSAVAVVGMSSNCTLNGPIVCDVGNMTAGAAAVLTITVTPTANGALTNTAVVAGNEPDANEANNEASAVADVLPVIDLAIHKSASADEIVIGRLITYTLTITNNGPSPATQVVVTDVLPVQVQLIGATVGCSGDETTVCEVGDLAVGETAVLTLTVMPKAVGVLTNTAYVSAAEFDGSLANNESQTETLILPEIWTVQLDGPDEGATGQEMSFTAVVAPISTTQPITYIWEATGQETVTHTNGLSDTVTFTWTLPGEQTVTVTAVNKWGEAIAVYTLVIESRLYLPIVLSNN